ncbi:hypothetical protein ACFLTI_01215 [Bacteroidota bacterium]
MTDKDNFFLILFLGKGDEKHNYLNPYALNNRRSLRKSLKKAVWMYNNENLTLP